MSGKSDFTAEEWTAITDAPFEVITIMFLAGAHGPISTLKESSAGAHALAQPGNRGSASGLIAEIVPEAEGKQARHDAGHPHGASRGRRHRRRCGQAATGGRGAGQADR